MPKQNANKIFIDRQNEREKEKKVSGKKRCEIESC